MSINKTSKNKICVLPWIQTSLRPDGKIYPCCKWDCEEIGSIYQMTMVDSLKSKNAKLIRKNFTDGITNSLCTACYEQEDVGVKSLRLTANEKHSDVLANIMMNDRNTEEFVSLQSLDLRISNRCNLKCRTCGPHFSSSWAIEQQKMVKKNADIDLNLKSVDWRKEIEWKNITDVYLAGGEPFLIKEYEHILEGCPETYAKKIRLEFSSNFSVYPTKNLEQQWRKFNSVTIGVSADGTENALELIRGVKWSQFNGVVDYFIKNHPNVNLVLTPTISALSIFGINSLVMYWVEKIKNPKMLNLYLNPLTYPRHYRLTVFTKEEKKSINDLLLKLLEFSANKDGLTKQKVNEIYIGLKALLDIEFVRDDRKNFRSQCLILDKIRGEHLVYSIPDLVDLITENF